MFIIVDGFIFNMDEIKCVQKDAQNGWINVLYKDNKEYFYNVSYERFKEELEKIICFT